MSSRQGITALYRSVGEELHHFDVDVKAASLTRRGTGDGSRRCPVRLTVPIEAVPLRCVEHPNGRFVYVANRASSTSPFEGKPVFQGGENTISVYAIDQSSGEPTMIQSIDSRGYHVRTFAVDASARLLVAATIAPITAMAWEQ